MQSLTLRMWVKDEIKYHLKVSVLISDFKLVLLHQIRENTENANRSKLTGMHIQT